MITTKKFRNILVGITMFFTGFGIIHEVTKPVDNMMEFIVGTIVAFAFSAIAALIPLALIVLGVSAIRPATREIKLEEREESEESLMLTSVGFIFIMMGLVMVAGYFESEGFAVIGIGQMVMGIGCIIQPIVSKTE